MRLPSVTSVHIVAQTTWILGSSPSHASPYAIYNLMSFNSSHAAKLHASYWSDVHVTVQRDKFLTIKPTRCTNFSNLFSEWNHMFRTVPLSIIMSFSLYTQQWCMSYRFADSLWAGSGWNARILLASCQQTCTTYTIAVCTVKNSWW
jgi:hypothetical protein